MTNPPHSIEAEKSILGSMLLEPETTIDRVRELLLTPESFYDFRHQILFDILQGMDGERVDAILIAQIITDQNMLEKVGGYDYLTELQEDVASSFHVEHYAKIILEKHRARLVLERAADAIEKIGNGSDPDLVNLSLVADLETIAPPQPYTMDDAINEAAEQIEMILRGELVTLPFPWREFQHATFGIPIGAVTPLLGRDKTGKSRLAIQLVEHWVSLPEPLPTLVFAFEDRKSRYLQAFASTIGSYDSFTIRRNPSPEHVKTVRASLERIKALPLYVVDDAKSAEDVAATIGAYKRKHGIKAVVIDGFKDIMATKGENRTGEENHIFETVKRAAGKYDVGVLQIEHTHDVLDYTWLSKRNIRGSKQRAQSARSFLIYQDCGFSEKLIARYGSMDECIVLDCPACSYGDPSLVVLRPELERGRFVEVAPAGRYGME